jgi:hypothetical protein
MAVTVTTMAQAVEITKSAVEHSTGFVVTSETHRKAVLAFLDELVHKLTELDQLQI